MQNHRPIIPEQSTIVIKIGTNLLADKSYGVNIDRVESLARSVSRFQSHEKHVAMVSSGAIGAGVAALGLKTRPKTLPEKQACAAIGQPLLMEAYEKAFRKQGRSIAQILLTKDDFVNRSRYVNSKNTFSTLFEQNVIPVVNENDTVAVEEIQFGDNDNLSAMVASLISADLLVILSDIDGLYSEKPVPQHKGTLIRVVEKITPQIERLARSSGSDLSTGGMVTKIQAAKRCTSSGTAVIIANGNNPAVLEEIAAGTYDGGTLFLPAGSTLNVRKKWIGFVSRVRGHVIVDDGAKIAIIRQNKSLLPSGILEVHGPFSAHDTISIRDALGNEIAKGVSMYSSAEVNLIKGKKTKEVHTLLHRTSPDEVVHRNNLVVIGEF